MVDTPLVSEQGMARLTLLKENGRLSVLGAGNFGVVIKAQDNKLNSTVAVKLIFCTQRHAARHRNGQLETARKFSSRYKDDDEAKGERRRNGRIQKHPMLLLPA